MINYLKSTTNNISLSLTPQVISVLRDSIKFSKSNIIIGDNGSGKSQIIGLLCALIDPDLTYDHLIYNSGIKYSPFSYFRSISNLYNELVLDYNKEFTYIYHQGLNKYSHMITDRNFGSNGENVIYELLYLTSDIKKYDNSLKNSIRYGEDIIKYKSYITKKFVDNKLDLTLLNPSTLICDEPELGLSMTRIKALISYLERWVREGNQFVITTNHPWLIDNWSYDINPTLIDLDKHDKFSCRIK